MNRHYLISGNNLIYHLYT